MTAEHSARVKQFVDELEHFIETKHAVLESLKQRGDEAAQTRRKKLLQELANDRDVLIDSVNMLTFCEITTTNPISKGEK